MITHDDAHRIAQEYVDSHGHDMIGDSLILLNSATIEKDWGWVFFYTSRLWHETHDFRYAIAGNAPFIVERASGRVVVTGTARSTDHYLDLYERHGDPHFEPSTLIRLVGCRQKADKLAAIKIVRDCSGVGLQTAQQLIEDCIASQNPCVSTLDLVLADQLVQRLGALGFVVRQLSQKDKANTELNTPP